MTNSNLLRRSNDDNKTLTVIPELVNKRGFIDTNVRNSIRGTPDAQQFLSGVQTMNHS